MKEVTRIACIGSRSIPRHVENLMEDIGAYIVEQQWYIASGNAEGSDYAFARGGNKIDPTHVILYTPVEGHNKKHIVKGNRVTWDLKPEWREVARAHHGNYDNLDEYIQKLMDRNAGILSRANKCIAYLNPKKKWGGGTAHGWGIAKTMGIPRFQIKDDTTFESVKAFLKFGV